MVEVIRTPDERFAGLPGWPYDPAYSEVDGLRLARVDVGDGDAPTAVLVHGEPTWGFLWRRVMQPLHDAGVRTVVPDQVGFGRSDKPADVDWYTYDRLAASLAGHLDVAELPDRVTVVVHDWGGPVGLRWAVEHAERVARLVILDTGLYTPGTRMSDTWQAFRDVVASVDRLRIGDLVRGGTSGDLAPEVVAAYEAPFHEDAAQAGAKALPLLVPTSDDSPGAKEMHAVFRALGEWQDPTLVLWGEDDPIIPPVVGGRLADHIPGAGPLETVAGGHFLQEDAGPEIGARIARFVSSARS